MSTKASQIAPSTPWHSMTVTQKTAFVGKLCMFFVTSGFVFPNVLSD